MARRISVPATIESQMTGKASTWGDVKRVAPESQAEIEAFVGDGGLMWFEPEAVYGPGATLDSTSPAITDFAKMPPQIFVLASYDKRQRFLVATQGFEYARYAIQF